MSKRLKKNKFFSSRSNLLTFKNCKIVAKSLVGNIKEIQGDSNYQKKKTRWKEKRFWQFALSVKYKTNQDVLKCFKTTCCWVGFYPLILCLYHFFTVSLITFLEIVLLLLSTKLLNLSYCVP